MFASISNEAWQPNADGKEICIMNDSGKSETNIDHPPLNKILRANSPESKNKR